MSTKYKVEIIPRLNDDDYGDAVDVSDRVKLKGINAIKKSLDSADYGVGIFTYSDITVTASNADGYFNNVMDSRSIFPYSRDLAKVIVTFFQDVDKETITFRGLINDEATKVVPKTEEISFRVLSKDSVIRQEEVQEGAIANGVTVQEALFQILNTDLIKKVLTVDIENINPAYNATVDDGSAFDNLDAREAIGQLLIASNSILIIDEDDNVIVKSRDENMDKEPLKLYGAGDLRGRENIIDLPNYNTGLQRVFNSITLNDVVFQNDLSVLTFGTRKKDISLDWVTNSTNRTNIGNAILNEFKYPKIELEVKIPTEIAKEYELLDRVSINFPYKLFPTSQFLPICGAFDAGDTDYLLPKIVGAVKIEPRVGFKIIEMTEDPKSFTTVLKLREIGTEVDDGLL